MIKYALECANKHVFEAWFPSSDAYDTQAAQGFVSCPICDSTEVSKALMAPAVSKRRKAELAATSSETPEESGLRAETPQTSTKAVTHASRELMEQLWEMRAKIEAQAENVGDAFAAEARAIHEGESDERAIWGDCSTKDAIELIEDGISIAPMPPARRDD